MKCLEQYVGFAINFTRIFPIHKLDIKLTLKITTLPNILIIYVLSILIHLYNKCSKYVEN